MTCRLLCANTAKSVQDLKCKYFNIFFCGKTKLLASFDWSWKLKILGPGQGNSFNLPNLGQWTWLSISQPDPYLRESVGDYLFPKSICQSTTAQSGPAEQQQQQPACGQTWQGWASVTICVWVLLSEYHCTRASCWLTCQQLPAACLWAQLGWLSHRQVLCNTIYYNICC